MRILKDIKLLFIMVLAQLVIPACDVIESHKELETVEVTLTLGSESLAKADSPLIPDVENLIYDVWILQYDNMGLLIDAGTSHERKTYPGSLIATVTANLAIGNDCTICVVANLDRGVTDSNRKWPQTLNDFKTSSDIIDLSADIAAANAGTLTDMPMSGYWEGNITSIKENIQVSLGRMLTRINLVLVNDSATDMVVSKIENASKKAYAFPNVNHLPLASEAYFDIPINQTVASGTTKEMYFYVAPNFTEGEAYATKLNIEGKTPVILSNGAPTDSPRDYNLYHNSNYTFTFYLK